VKGRGEGMEGKWVRKEEKKWGEETKGK